VSRQGSATAALRVLVSGEVVYRVALEFASAFAGDRGADELVLEDGMSFAAVLSAGLADEDSASLADREDDRRLEAALDGLDSKGGQTDLHLVFGGLLSLCVQFTSEVHRD